MEKKYADRFAKHLSEKPSISFPELNPVKFRFKISRNIMRNPGNLQQSSNLIFTKSWMILQWIFQAIIEEFSRAYLRDLLKEFEEKL